MLLSKTEDRKDVIMSVWTGRQASVYMDMLRAACMLVSSWLFCRRCLSLINERKHNRLGTMAEATKY